MITNAFSYEDHFPTEVSFPVVFFKHASQNDKIALIDSDNEFKITFNEFVRRTSCYESFLFSLLAPRKEKLVVIICRNSLKLVSVMLAITNLAYTVLPLNPSSKKYEIESNLANLEVNCIITDSMTVFEYLKEKNVLISLQNIIESTPRKDISMIQQRSEPAFLFFSSGTTGSPRVIEISHGSVIGLFNQLKSVLKFSSQSFITVDEGDKVYGVLPYFHLGGLFTLFTMMFLGATVYINDKFDPQNFLTSLVKNEITTLNLVPPILNLLEKMKLKLPSLKKVYVGASTVDAKQIRRLQRIYPSTKFIQLYGMTEAGLILFMTSAESDDASSIGIAFPGVQAKIVNKELLVKTPTMMNRYVREMHLFNKEDWFRTGDLVESVSDNKLRIIGRIKSMIKVRSWQINPEEIELMIAEKGGATDSVLHYLELKNDSKLILQTTGNPETIRSLLRENLISYKHAFWIIRTNFSNKTESGKTKRNNFVSILANL